MVNYMMYVGQPCAKNSGICCPRMDAIEKGELKETLNKERTCDQKVISNIQQRRQLPENDRFVWDTI